MECLVFVEYGLRCIFFIFPRGIEVLARHRSRRIEEGLVAITDGSLNLSSDWLRAQLDCAEIIVHGLCV